MNFCLNFVLFLVVLSLMSAVLCAVTKVILSLLFMVSLPNDIPTTILAQSENRVNKSAD